MRSGRRRKRNRFEESEDLNPMNYLSNLSDVMLVLAVGIMVALILHWNVQIDNTDAAQSGSSQNGQDSTVTFTQDELESQENVPDDMQRMGDVYYDKESGTYYIIKNKEGEKK